jgi:hypothetical protein
MTRDEFRELPLLLRPDQAREVFACDKHTLTKLRKQNPDMGVRLPGMRHWRYRKVVVARIVGLG